MWFACRSYAYFSIRVAADVRAPDSKPGTIRPELDVPAKSLFDFVDYLI